jgi:predicted acyl esterase
MDQLSQPQSGVVAQYDIRVPMRDGVELSTDLWLPQGEGPWPVILCRTPYNKNGGMHVEEGHYYASRGYAWAVQDVRGRFDSEGVWVPARGRRRMVMMRSNGWRRSPGATDRWACMVVRIQASFSC